MSLAWRAAAVSCRTTEPGAGRSGRDAAARAAVPAGAASAPASGPSKPVLPKSCLHRFGDQPRPFGVRVHRVGEVGGPPAEGLEDVDQWRVDLTGDLFDERSDLARDHLGRDVEGARLVDGRGRRDVHQRSEGTIVVDEIVIVG